MSITSVLFAVFGLSFLIFIHELGHYFVARWAGMKVEVFSVGMGKPIVSWKHKGVKWQICYLIFGGYVKIAGMEGENGKEPHQVRNGFYSKKPLQRILVAAAGPAVNIVFALMVFTGIYFYGGQDKPFSQFTKVVGQVDKESSIYEEGVRSGDRIVSVNDQPYNGFRDIFYQGMLKNNDGMSIVVDKRSEGEVISKVSFYSPKNTLFAQKEYKTMGILAPASYVIYTADVEEKYQSTLSKSGIKKGDRIVYVDGNVIYSTSQMSEVISRDVALVTVDRDGKKIHLQVPRILLGDLKLSDEQKDEFVDYKRNMNLEGAIASTYYIPYLVSEGLYVTEELFLIETDDVSKNEHALKKGDKILAVSGVNVSSSEEFYQAISERKCLVMVSSSARNHSTWTNTDSAFMKDLDFRAISSMENQLGSEELKAEGKYQFLTPTKPVSNRDFYEQQDPAKLKQVRGLVDEDTFNQWVNKQTIFSNARIADEKVVYNPNPFVMMKDLINDFIFSLKNLLTGSISPKHMSGPIGMIKLVHDSSKSSMVTGVYWLGMISLNLAFMNLLPIPMLDGGHICFTLYEMGTKKRIKAKTMQRLILPFFAMIVTFFIYITFYDIVKFFS